jgi:PBP1b-binding outer membrane lipoprotein LpoB
MKRLVALTMLLLLLAGCSRPLQNDAVTIAREHWKFTQLGPSYYLCEIRGAAKTVF